MIHKMTRYFGEVGQELSKVSWPSREELYGSVVVVVVFCAALSLFIFGIDRLLSHLLQLVF